MTKGNNNMFQIKVKITIMGWMDLFHLTSMSNSDLKFRTFIPTGINNSGLPSLKSKSSSKSKTVLQFSHLAMALLNVNILNSNKKIAVRASKKMMELFFCCSRRRSFRIHYAHYCASTS